MDGKRILALGPAERLSWTERLPALASAAGIAGHALQTTDDVDLAERQVAQGRFEVLAVCDDEVIGGADLDRLFDAAAPHKTFRRVHVEETTGDPDRAEALRDRLDRIDLRAAWPISWLVRTGEVEGAEASAQLWFRSIYAPAGFDPAELPPHPAHDIHWDEVRRHRARRPPRD